MENSNPPPSSGFIRLFDKVLGSVEKIALVITLFGLLSHYQHWPTKGILLLGLFSLAIVFFLRAFQLVKASHGYISLVNKLGFIGSSVGAMAILFSLSGFEGSQQMLTVSTPTLAGTVVATGLLSVKFEDTFRALKPMLFRAIPTLLFCVYLFFPRYFIN